LLIHNNTKGEDTKILKKFKEPSWNYQVIRFIDEDEKDIIARKDGISTLGKLVPRIEEVLNKQKIALPNSLKLLKLETETAKHKTAVFAMYCFWTGEMKLGSIDGVIRTEAGWFDGREVVKVTYHTDKVKLAGLLKKAEAIQCADTIYLTNADEQALAKRSSRLKVGKLTSGYKKAKASDQLKQLSGTKYAKLKLTPIQSTKLNSFARTDAKKAKSYLTKAQLEQLKQ